MKRKPTLPRYEYAPPLDRFPDNRPVSALDRREPIRPGYELMRLRLQYAHKGPRPLARIP